MMSRIFPKIKETGVPEVSIMYSGQEAGASWSWSVYDGKICTLHQSSADGTQLPAAFHTFYLALKVARRETFRLRYALAVYETKEYESRILLETDVDEIAAILRYD